MNIHIDEKTVLVLILMGMGLTVILGSFMLFFSRKPFVKHLLVCLSSSCLILAVLFVLQIFLEYPTSQFEWADLIISYIVATPLALCVGAFVGVIIGLCSTNVRDSEKD